jgi:aspartyl-tRNA(Asn)/glutamyl-tRNA(Gln) amidotransferase subunit C
MNNDDFAKLVKQANLTLSENEKSKIHSQLDEALVSVKVMSELDTSKVLNTVSASGLTNVWREDIIQPSFSQELALQNTKQTHNGYFMVPAIFEPKDT